MLKIKKNKKKEKVKKIEKLTFYGQNKLLS
jgi:hypothetical protein